MDKALKTFIAGCERISNEHMTGLPYVTKFRVIEGKKYYKLQVLEVRTDGREESRGVHCFVDIKTGDVLLAASWKAPAKGARGNIHDENNGLGRMGPYGPAYNK